MFKVFIEGAEFKSVEFSQCNRLEDAVALALYLHRSSNVPHLIHVYDVDKDESKISFELKKDE